MSQNSQLFAALVSPVAVPKAVANLVRVKREGEARAAMSGWSDLDPNTKAFLEIGAAVLIGIIIVRAAAAYYIGKQFGRPKASAAMGAFFGAPGVGVVSLWGKGKK